MISRKPARTATGSESLPLKAGCYQFKINCAQQNDTADQALPTYLTFIKASGKEDKKNLLFIDHIPVPYDNWRFDYVTNTLTWAHIFGGGHLWIASDGLSINGHIGNKSRAINVSGGAIASFDCKVALNTGSALLESHGNVTGLSYDVQSDAWRSADWGNNRLKLSYEYIPPQRTFGEASYDFSFQDLATGARPWQVNVGADSGSSAYGSVKPSAHAGQFGWDLVFKAPQYVPDDRDISGKEPEGPKTVYPRFLQATEDGSASIIAGAYYYGELFLDPTICGLKGVRSLPSATGYYSVSRTTMPFGLFNGQLRIGDNVIAESKIVERTLHWQNLTQEQQQLTGLPKNGQLLISKNGDRARCEKGILRVTRLLADVAIERLSRFLDDYPSFIETLTTLDNASENQPLSIYGLLMMNPFNSKGVDEVQSQVSDGLSVIMNNNIPNDIWSLLFPGQKKPLLTDDLAIIEASGGQQAKDWYSSLSTAVLTQGMANTENKNTEQMNGPRASSWLRDQIASSQSFKDQTHQLYNLKWNEKFPETVDYLEDQISNAPQYHQIIDEEVDYQITLIDQSVSNSASQPTLKQDLKDKIKEVGQYAKEHNLYWAFFLYTRVTSPNVLTNIMFSLQLDGSSERFFQQMVQQYASTLSALDETEQFVKWYIETINQFALTNILPSMFGFNIEAMDASIIKLYMNKLVEENLTSESEQIREAASQINQVLQQQDIDAIFSDCIAELSSISQLIYSRLKYSEVVFRFEGWFAAKFPKLTKLCEGFAGVFCSGLAILGVFSLIIGFKNWDKLSDQDRASTILFSVQMGTRVLANVIKDSVHTYAVFEAGGWNSVERSAAFLGEEAQAIEYGMSRIGNRTLRWFGGKRSLANAQEFEAWSQEAFIADSIDELFATEVAGAEDTWLETVFGSNIDEFISRRLGPVLILAGIGISVWALIDGGLDSEMIAFNVLNIVSGVAFLFSTFMATGTAATMVSVLGYAAAIAGFALLIYEAFGKKRPTPVETFIKDYVDPQGFGVTSACNAIDYAIQYTDDDTNELMVGFSLSADGNTLSCQQDGSIKSGHANKMPDTVWVQRTNGLGLSQIVAKLPSTDSKKPVSRYLSLMKDGSVKFAPLMTAIEDEDPIKKTDIVSQTWLTSPSGEAETANQKTALTKMALKIQPVYKDKQDQILPSGAKGWLTFENGHLQTSTQSSTVFTLTMSGMAPNYMTLPTITYHENNLPFESDTYDANFGVIPSFPHSWQLLSELPPFLKFNKETGTVSPNGEKAQKPGVTTYSVKLTNPFGSESAKGYIEVIEKPA